MPDILTNDKVWVNTLEGFDDRTKGTVVVVRSDGAEAVVTLDNGIHVRVPTARLELRETHE